MTKNKRGQGDGTIFEERPGRWVAVLSMGSKIIDGKQRRNRKKFVGRTRRVVQEKLTAALRKQDQSLPVATSRESFCRYFERWLVTAKARIRDSTHASYAVVGRLYLIPHFGTVPLQELTAQHVNGMMDAITAAGLSPRTCQYAQAIARKVLADAEKLDLVSRNVAKLSTAPRSEKAEITPLTVDQARLLLGGVQGHRLEALYSVALAVGLRRGEACALAWPDIDLEAGTLTVRRTLQRIKADGSKRGALRFTEMPKTASSRRFIPLPPMAIRSLRDHQARQAQERLFMGDDWKGAPLDLVFSTTLGTPVEPRNVLRHLQQTLITLKLPHHRFHDLRHTAASLLLAQGCTLHTVKEILGHSQIALTANLYGHLFMSVARDAMSGMDAALSPVVTQVVTPEDSPTIQ
jgi:integrase